jgi:cytochrome c
MIAAQGRAQGVREPMVLECRPARPTLGLAGVRATFHEGAFAMKALIVAAALVVGVGAAGVAQAQEDLAKSAGCTTCHAMDTKKMGPAFKEIAKKYKGNAGAEAKLVEALSKGQGHPAVKASPDDIKKLVKWNLSL